MNIRSVVRLTGKLPESVSGSLERAFENDWDFWVYPSAVDVTTPSGVLIVDNLDQSARSELADGGRVLLFIPPEKAGADPSGRIALGFSSIFWNTAWTRGQPPHTLGILCDPDHPALAAFPTECHSNWQWWYIVTRAGAMILDDFSPGLEPIVQVIDDWFTARKLGLLFEAEFRSGKLLVCSVDLRQDADKNPVARQMLHSLLQYMDSDHFSPSESLNEKQIQSLISGSPDQQTQRINR